MRSITVVWYIFACGLYLQIEAKTYYFNVNKTSNEFMIYNRVNLNNSHNNYPSPTYLGELRNNITRNKNTTSGIQTHPLLDPEWNYNWQNITRPKLPSYIPKLYESISKVLTGPIRILFNSMPQNSTIIKLNLSAIDQDISDAELHFYYTVDKKLSEKPLILRLYQMENYFNESSLINPDAHKLLNVIYISHADNGWQAFKLTNNIHNWLVGRKNLTLLITISKPNEEQFTLFKEASRDSFRTFMVLKSELPQRGGRSDIVVSNHNCRKQDLHIDFERLNWMKFIILPTGYNAFNCVGRCYRSDNLPNHVTITSFVPELARKALCCVPIDYSPLPIMFYDRNGNIAIKLYEEMVVASCGCR